MILLFVRRILYKIQLGPLEIKFWRINQKFLSKERLSFRTASLAFSSRYREGSIKSTPLRSLALRIATSMLNVETNSEWSPDESCLTQTVQNKTICLSSSKIVKESILYKVLEFRRFAWFFELSRRSFWTGALVNSSRYQPQASFLQIQEDRTRMLRCIQLQLQWLNDQWMSCLLCL